MLSVCSFFFSFYVFFFFVVFFFFFFFDFLFCFVFFFFFFSSRRRHTRLVSDWSSDVCSSDLWGWMPIAEAIRHPSPGIGRDPHVTARSEIPIAIGEGVPAGVYPVGLPHGAVAGDLKVLPVIIQVAHAVLVRRVRVVAALGVGAQILIALGAPLVEAVGLRPFFQVVAVGIEQIEGKGLFLFYCDLLA